MQLTLDIVLSWIGGAASGAFAAYFGNRIVHAEMWGHLRKHCGEIDALRRTSEKRLDAHSDRIAAMQQTLAVLLDAKLRFERQLGGGERER